MGMRMISRVPTKVAIGATVFVCLLLVAAVLIAYQGKTFGFAMLSVQNDKVTYQRGDNPPTTMRVDETSELRRGDSVGVDGDGEATLQFADFLRVRIFRDSELRIEEISAADAPPIYKFLQTAGATFNTTTAQELIGKRVQVSLETKWATIEDIGTEFFTYVDPESESTWVIVKNGAANVTADGETKHVDAGYQTWIDPGEPPAEPVPATRLQVGNRFPLIDDLTNGAIKDTELLQSNELPLTPTPESDEPQDTEPVSTSTRAGTATNEPPETPTVATGTSQSTATTPKGLISPTATKRGDSSTETTGRPGRSTDTPTPTPTRTPTITPTPTWTPTPTPTATYTPTLTPTATYTPTPPPCTEPLISGFKELWEGNEAIREQLGCPLYPEKGIGGAWQPFQSGEMIWLKLDDVDSGCLSNQSDQWIFVLYDSGLSSVYEDKFREDGQPESDPTIIPPAELYQPVRGFGRLWREHPEVRSNIGWGTETERGTDAAFQRFENGFMVFLGIFNNERIWVFDNAECGPSNGSWQEFDDTFVD
jgi:hypothetical protein